MCCRPLNTRTFWGWSPNHTAELFLGWSLFRDWELSLGVVSPNATRRQIFIITLVSYNYLANHLAFSSNKPMNIKVKQIWSGVLTFLHQSSGVAKEEVPNLLHWLNGTGEFAEPEVVQRHWIMPYCTSNILCVTSLPWLNKEILVSQLSTEIFIYVFRSTFCGWYLTLLTVL